MNDRIRSETRDCPICDGDGEQIINDKEYTCKRCAGTGKVKAKKKTCGPCNGTGEETYAGVKRKCPYCDGRGWRGNWLKNVEDSECNYYATIAFEDCMKSGGNQEFCSEIAEKVYTSCIGTGVSKNRGCNKKCPDCGDNCEATIHQQGIHSCFNGHSWGGWNKKNKHS